MLKDNYIKWKSLKYIIKIKTQYFEEFHHFYK